MKNRYGKENKRFVKIDMIMKLYVLFKRWVCEWLVIVIVDVKIVGERDIG